MYRFVLIFFFVFCLATVGLCEQVVPTLDTSQPIEILSQQLEVLQQENRSVFSGDVVATQGDMTLNADRLIIYFVGENQVDRLEASGSVRFSQLDRVATADKAIYHQQDGILLLQGNAGVTQGSNQVNGDEITFYVHENRSVVKGSSQKRVKAVIVQEPQKTKDVE